MLLRESEPSSLSIRCRLGSQDRSSSQICPWWVLQQGGSRSRDSEPASGRAEHTGVNSLEGLRVDELYQQNIYQCSLILRKNMSQTKCSLVLSAVVINQGGWQGSCYIGKHWTKVHPGKWHHDMIRDWGVRCAVCNECKLRKCMGLYCGVKGNASNLKEKPIGPVQVAVWRHLVVVVFSDVASGPCSSGVSRTTVGIAGISTRSDDICQTEKIDQGTEYRLRTPCLSPCVLRQSLPLHHIPYPTEARTFTHHGNSVATTISNQPPWPHSENQSSFISSKPHWHGAVGWGIFYKTLEEWLQSSENYNRGQDCTFLNLFTATLLFAISWAVLPRASSCSWCLSQVLASDPGVQERLLSLTGALSLCLMLPLPSFSCLLFSPLHSFSIFLPTSN